MNKFHTTKTIVLFLCIMALGAFLRFYRLSQVPPGANRDEASIGYTAFSLLKTGKDEYARPFPLSFQSFGDWKLPLYIYTDIPFVSILGPNELAIRLPSALAGLATVAVIFFLVTELTGNQTLALASMAILAVSPWHLHLSRVESESNVAVFFMSLEFLTFLKSIRRRKHHLILISAILFALTYFTYAGNHISTTLIVFGITLIYWPTIPKTKIAFFAAALFAGLAGIILTATLLGADRTKLAGISIFGDPFVVHEKIELKRLEHKPSDWFFAKLMHNRVIYAAETIGQNYLKSFSPQFLFISGGTNRAHNIADFGNMYLVEAPFLLLGIAALLASVHKRESAILLWWFFVSAVAASITKDAPHTNRMFAIFPILPIVVAFGILWLLEKFANGKLKKVLIGVIIGLYLVNGAVYIDRYYIHFPRDESANWGAGYKALNQVINSPSYKTMHIIMAHPETSPYIYFLLYSAYDPNLYFSSVVRYPPTQDQFVDVKHFGRFDFRAINWGEDYTLKNTLLIAPSVEVPQGIRNAAHTVTDIILPNGVAQFTVIEPQ